MPTITRAQISNQLVPGLHAVFGVNYKNYPEEHLEIFGSANKSSRAWEEEVGMYMLGAARRRELGEESQPTEYGAMGETYVARYNMRTYVYGFSVTEEAIEDNQYESIATRGVKHLARSFYITKQSEAAAVLNNAFSGSFLGPDGVALASTAHPIKAGGSNANRPATIADLNETSLEAATIAIAKWQGQNGLLINVTPQKLIVPVDYTYVANRILNSTLRSGTNNNDINALKAMGVVKGMAVNHWLTSATSWFVTTDCPDGLKHFERLKLQLTNLGDFETGNMRWRARERYCFGWSDPLGIYAGSS